MYYLLALVCAAAIAIMVALNGNLSHLYDVFAATAIIHLAGLILISAIVFAKREKLKPKKAVFWVTYLGGAVGVGTTVFNNAAFGKISVSAILALSLLAQAITSLCIDHFGWFHMPRRKFSAGKLVGLLFTCGGIGFLLYGSQFAFWPIAFSLITGITIVVSRSINAELAENSSMLVSTWYNFMVGLLTTCMVWLMAVWLGYSTFHIQFEFHKTSDIWAYTGGLLGVLCVFLLNVVVKRISAFIMTLIMFVGQLFTGVCIDWILGEQITVLYCLGGLLAMFGLCINLYLDRKSGNL